MVLKRKTKNKNTTTQPQATNKNSKNHKLQNNTQLQYTKPTNWDLAPTAQQSSSQEKVRENKRGERSKPTTTCQNHKKPIKTNNKNPKIITN